MAAPDLAELILEKTLQGKLAWERLSNDAYSTVIGRNNIVIEPSRSPREEIFLRIANEDGLVVETLRSSDRLDDTLENLYESARRKALRVDDVLSQLKQNLEKL